MKQLFLGTDVDERRLNARTLYRLNPRLFDTAIGRDIR